VQRPAPKPALRRALPALLALAILVAIAIAGPASASAACTPSLSASASTLPNGGMVVLAGSTCSSRGRLLAGWDGKWHPLARIVSARRDGRFVKSVKLRVNEGVSTVKIKAASPTGVSPQVRVKVAEKGTPTPAPAPPASPSGTTAGSGSTGSSAAAGSGDAKTTAQPVLEHEPVGAPEPPSEKPTSIPTPTPTPEPEAEAPSVETPPVKTPPVEVPPVKTPPVEVPPVEVPPVETPPVEVPPVETPPVEVPPVEVPPVEIPHEEPTPEPEPEPGGCALAPATAGTLLAMAMPSCPRIASDTTSESNPMPFWGSVDCAAASRYATVSTGGDEHDTAEGTEQDNTSYRRLTVLNGDDDYGARCELGFNNHERGPTAFYREGDHRVTYFSERLPSNFPINTSMWQTVMQMKQAEPQHDDGSGVALEMQVMNGRWYVLDHWNVVWSFPAQTGVWTRFAYDVYYSNNPEKGWLQVSADLNDDGDFEDPGERSPVIHADTLATEVPGYPRDGITPGTGIPSHLRIGLYHNPEIPCPAPTGCSIDVDNVQVVAP
jgi:hypothetical protein